jgi:hypothetical protein
MATALAIFTVFTVGIGVGAVVNAIRLAHRKHKEQSGLHDGRLAA